MTKILLCGEAGVGKSSIANILYERFFNVHVIDGDTLREDTQNFDYTMEGRKLNMANAKQRVDFLSSLNKHVVVAMQAPTVETRELYFYDFIKIRLTNSNNTKIIENEIKPNYDWSGVDYTFEYQELLKDINPLIDLIYPKVCVIGRFQPLHKGHTLPIERAFQISPRVTAAIRKEDGDIYELDEVKENLLQKYKFEDVIFTPKLKDDNWEFIKEFDIVVQGNPEVIEKIKPYNVDIDFVPRIGTVSATNIRNGKMINMKF